MIIYKITNLINGKVYVGLTTTALSKRWNSHVNSAHKSSNKCTAISLAIVKYGKENFTIEEIDSAKNKEELAKKEIKWIEKLESISKGYNIRTGGDIGYKQSEETNNKNRASHLGKKHSPETIKKLKQISCGENNPFFGKKHDNFTVEKMRKAKLGKLHTDEQKMKRSVKAKEDFLSGKSIEKLKKANECMVKKISKPYSFVSPDGKIFHGTNLTKFCREQRLRQSHMHSVLNGKRTSHKGWVKNPNLFERIIGE